MCNLYRNSTGAAEVARLFKVEPGDIATGNAAEEVYPGYPGMVVREQEGHRVLQSMSWGFPVRLKSMKPTSKPKAVNNARDDKLGTPFWRPSFESRRCIIPITQWAEAEGETGRMTRTWYSLLGTQLFAVAGIWRPTDEWGNAYSMVMVDGCPQMSDVHDRMPVLLTADQYDPWMRAPAEEALALVRTCHDDLAVDRSTELWFKPRAKPSDANLI
ncbi:MAG: SOS response-associated peptidase family protein [Novosphingobium sp.]|nr:SOS response-associated peptidase family protein [Novosphingobium sp.]